MAKKCWDVRPCDEEMRNRCAHADVKERCPVKCHFAACWSKKHVQAEDPFTVLVDLDLTEDWPVKESCLACDFFHKSHKK